MQLAEIGLGESAPPGEQGAIEQGFGDAQGAAVGTGDEPHGGVGVSREPGLIEGSIESWDVLTDSWVYRPAHPLGEPQSDLFGVDAITLWSDWWTWWGGVVAVA